MIVRKLGPCCDCPSKSPRLLYAKGRCELHYWLYRAKEKAAEASQRAGPAGRKLTTTSKKALTEWFKYHMSHSLVECENCHLPLTDYDITSWHSSQHHIIEKHLCPSVMAELDNHCVLGFYCCHQQAHASYEKLSLMPVFPLLQERFELFKNKITPDEVKFIPDVFIKTQSI